MARLKTSSQLTASYSRAILAPNGRPAIRRVSMRFDSMNPRPTSRQVRTAYNRVESDDIPFDWSRKQMISYARDGFNNFDIVRGLVTRLTNFVVGKGNRLICDFEDKELNRAVEYWYNNVYAEECDGRGRQNLWELQAALFQRWYIDGESFVFHLPNASIFGLEADQIESWSGWKSMLPADYVKSHPDIDKWQDIQGVICDAWGSPRQYVVCRRETPNAPQDYFLVNSSAMTHIAEFPRLRQARGVSSLITVIAKLADQSDYFRAELTAAKVSAKWAVAISKQNSGVVAETNSGTGIDDSDTEGEAATTAPVSAEEAHKPYTRLESVMDGAVEYLQPGEKIEQVKAERPNVAFGQFIESSNRLFGAAQSVPLELLTLDFSKTNFASSKAAMLLAWSYIDTVQCWWNRRTNRPIAINALQYGQDSKQLPKLPKNWKYRLGFSNPTLPQVNRSQEEYARSLALANGTTTLEMELQGSEDSWQDIQRQRFEEQVAALQYEKKLLEERRKLELPELPATSQQAAPKALIEAVAKEIAKEFQPNSNGDKKE